MKEGMNKSILAAIIVVVALGVGYALMQKSSAPEAILGEALDINSDAYHAVFLSNGQVYFGKVSHPSSQYVTLQEVFYLQVQTTLQPKDEDAEGEQTKQSEVKLVKLGQELHGPNDRMDINRDHVLFIEELKPESKVVQTIQNFKNKKNQPTDQNTNQDNQQNSNTNSQ